MSQRDLEYVAAAGFDRRVGMARRKHDRHDAAGDRRHEDRRAEPDDRLPIPALACARALTSSGGDGRRVRLRKDPGGDEHRILIAQAVAPCRHHAGAALANGLGDARAMLPP